MAAVHLLGGSITGTTGTLTSSSSYDVQSGTISAILGGSVGLTKTGDSASTVILSGANTSTGVTTLSAGTLALGASNVLSDTSTVTVSGGTLDIGSNSDTVAAVHLLGGSIIGTTGALTSTSTYDVQSGTISAKLGGSAGLTKTGGSASMVTIFGANTYAGATTVSAGTLALAASNVLSDSSTLAVNGGTLDIGANSDTVAAVHLLGGSITGTTGMLTSSSTYDVQSGTVSAVLGGSVGLTKTGAGSVTLLDVNLYAGGTTISQGVLNLIGTLAGGVVSVNGGTLAGSGTVASPMTVGSGALMPANFGTNSLMTGDVNLASGSTYLLQNAAIAAATNYTAMRVTGAVNLNGVSLDTSGVSITDYPRVLVLIKNDGTDAVQGTFAGLPEGAAVLVNGVYYNITYRYNAETGMYATGNDVALYRNIALGRSYSYPSPYFGYNPNQALSASTALTNGYFRTDPFWFWGQPSSLVWVNTNETSITVDLGQDMPISGAMFHTAVGSSAKSIPLCNPCLGQHRQRELL